MKRRELHRQGRPASDLLEEAVRLLRSAPLSAWLAYYIGTVPGMLGALYFYTDMGRNANAHERVVGASLALTVAWLWMKCWQAVFASRLRAEVLLLDPPEWTAGRVAHLVLAQVALQPLGLVLRPLALLLTIPYIWVATFFQNVTVLGDGEPRGLWELCRRAFGQCKLWPLQAHAAASLLFVFGFFVWLNVVSAILLVPQIANMLFGMDSQFTQHPLGLLNMTFFAATFAAAYLILDPLRKAINVLRCFYGSSLRTGEDLEVQIKTVRRMASRVATAATAVLLFFGALGTPPAGAAVEEAPPPVGQADPKISSGKIDQSLNEVLQRREFAWRAPRKEAPPSEDNSWLGKLRKDFANWVEGIAKSLRGWMTKLMKKFFDWIFPEKRFDPGGLDSGGPLSWFGNVRSIAIILIVVAAVILIVLLARRRRPTVTAEAVPAASLVDLNEEHVTADQLPEDGWLALARELMQGGQLRLALRASYLAGLAHLGHRELIRLAKYKSNHDYDRELQRRARANPELLTAFERNLTAFERAWYGEHEVTTETLGDFSRNLERIRAC